MAKVAFLGLGVMGYPMAGHLLKKGGHEVTVFNRTAAKAQQWAKEYGGKHAPTPREEVRILHARAPLASPDLVSAVTRLINCVRRDMPAVRDKPGLRESIELLEALVRDGVRALTDDVIDQYLCFLGKRHKELLNLRQGLARLETAARRADDEIDEWVELAFANDACVLEVAA